MTSSNAHLAEIRQLEARLESSLLALDFAEKRQEPTFAPAARVAAIQQRLDHIRGAVAEHPDRRAAWLAQLAKSEACNTIQDGPAAAVSPARRRPKSTSGSTGAIVFPQID